MKGTQVLESLRIGLRVPHVDAARKFYRGMGFEEIAVIPSPHGVPVLAILHWRGAHLIVEALAGIPFAESDHEEKVQSGPRGLGVTIGMAVEDLDAVYAYCKSSGCVITSEPSDHPYGDRVFECHDPYGYVWEFSMTITDQDSTNAAAATANAWFGEDH